MISGIYGVLDSITRKIVYLGRSADIDNRMNGQRQKWKDSTSLALEHGVIPSPVNQSIDTCFAYLSLDGRSFEYVILEEVSDKEQLELAEHTWSDILIDAGHPLCNGNEDSLFLGTRYKSQAQQAYFIAGEEMKTVKYNRLEHPSVWLDKEKACGIWASGHCILNIPTIAMLRECNAELYKSVIKGELTSHQAIQIVEKNNLIA